ncbi:MAG: hypothetical protein QQW96_03235 [Tychonema bourrellyi B0820]|nr:hypothetical protein [Tychonema bourrellyi B0820]
MPPKLLYSWWSFRDLDMVIGNGALGIGHRDLGIGYGALVAVK